MTGFIIAMLLGMLSLVVPSVLVTVRPGETKSSQLAGRARPIYS